MKEINLKKLLVFLMAGGKGERLYPLTKYRAKPAVPFGGVYRIVDFTLSNCLNSGIRRIIVLSQYKSLSLVRHIRMGWNIFDSTLGEFIDIVPAQQRVPGHEHWYRGTADAIFQNIDSINAENPDNVLVLAGDHIYKMNYLDMLKFHHEKDADVTVGVIQAPKEESALYGVLQINSDSRIIDFSEKSAQPKTMPGKPDVILASMGIYIFKAELLKPILKKDAEVKSEHDFGKNIIPSMIKKYKAYAFNFIDERKEPKYWRDVGTIDAYYEANMDLVAVTPAFNFYDAHWPIRTYQEQFPPAKTVFDDKESKRVGVALNSLISNGCIISGGKVTHSVLSPNVRVNSFAEISDSIIMEGVNIGRGARIKRAIIDKDVDIPKGMVIGQDLNKDKKRFFVSEKGVVVVAKKTRI